MELLLDTANVEELRQGLAQYPVCGITSNPSILKKEGKVDLWAHLQKIKVLAAGRSLHVQVVATTRAEIVAEAHKICQVLGQDCFVKIPVSEEGLAAMGTLARAGMRITATAVYSSMQGILAALAGAEYIAVYYNRCENNDTDPCVVIAEIAAFIARSGFGSKVLGASYQNVTQVVKSFGAGAKAVTVSPGLLRTALSMPSIGKAVADFTKDFEEIHGVGCTMTTL